MPASGGRRERRVGAVLRHRGLVLAAALSAGAIACLGAGCGAASSSPGSATAGSPAASSAATSPASSPASSPGAGTSPSSAAAPEATTPHPAIIDGAGLFVTDGCSACHSLSGATGIGPPLAGVGGPSLTLADGRHVLATSAVLREALLQPARLPIKGYPPRLMAVAVARLRLSRHLPDVDALVAFIESAQ
jgi:hypothetical protein